MTGKSPRLQKRENALLVFKWNAKDMLTFSTMISHRHYCPGSLEGVLKIIFFVP